MIAQLHHISLIQKSPKIITKPSFHVKIVIEGFVFYFFISTQVKEPLLQGKNTTESPAEIQDQFYSFGQVTCQAAHEWRSNFKVYSISEPTVVTMFGGV